MISKQAAKERARKAQITKRRREAHPCLCKICMDSRTTQAYAGARLALIYAKSGMSLKGVEKKIEEIYPVKERGKK